VTAEPKGWGGPRAPGPGKRLGRPPAGDQPAKRRTVWLTDEQWERIKELGGGNASAGVRRLLEVGQAASAMDAAFSEFGDEPAYIHEAAERLHGALHAR
jgi:hypothetical protein